MQVILGQGVSRSNMKRQTEAMYLFQCLPPLFGHGYSHYSLLPLGNSLFHIQSGFLSQSLPLEVEYAQNRDVSFQLLNASSSVAWAQSAMPLEKNVFDSYYLQQLARVALN